MNNDFEIGLPKVTPSRCSITRRQFGFGAMTLAGLGLAGCKVGAGAPSWRQKLSLTAYTSAGEVTASSVSEVAFVEKLGRDVVNVKGQALVMDLGSGRTLFALLDKNHAYLVPRTLLGFTGSNEDKLPRNLAYGKLADDRDVHSVEFANCPQLLTFASIKQPLSAARVNPAQLDSYFGTGFGIKSITVEVTDEPVSENQIATVLPAEFFGQWSELLKEPKESKKGKAFAKSALAGIEQSAFKNDV